MASQARGRRGGRSEERLEQGERVMAIPVPCSTALLPPQVPASSVACRSRAASSYLCSLIMFSSVHMFPYIVNLTFSRCSFCEREKSERPCHSAKTFILTASFPLEDMQACSSKSLFQWWARGLVHTHRSDACIWGVKPALLLLTIFSFPYWPQRTACLSGSLHLPHVTRQFVVFASTSKSLEHAVAVKDPLKCYYTFLVLHSGVSVVCIFIR